MQFGRINMRIVVAAVLVAVGWAGVAAAQGGQGGQAQQVFTLQPGASTSISFEGFCYQFGEPFPAALRGPGGLAEGNIRAALALAVAQGLTGSDEDALQVQYAIWQLQGEPEAPQGGQLAQDVLNRVRAAPAPAAPQATSLIQAIEAGQVSVEVAEFAPVGQPLEIAPGVSDNFYGRGRLVVTSQAAQPIDLYMPLGTLITAANPEEQDIVAYATGAQGDQAAPAQQASASPTQGSYPAPTTAATTTPTSAPTTAPTTAATTAPTTVPTTAATTAPTTAATIAPTTAPTAAAQPTPRSYLEPVNPQPSNLPNTSGGAGPLAIAGALGVLGLAAGAARRLLRRR